MDNEQHSMTLEYKNEHIRNDSCRFANSGINRSGDPQGLSTINRVPGVLNREFCNRLEVKNVCSRRFSLHRNFYRGFHRRIPGLETFTVMGGLNAMNHLIQPEIVEENVMEPTKPKCSKCKRPILRTVTGVSMCRCHVRCAGDPMPEKWRVKP